MDESSSSQPWLLHHKQLSLLSKFFSYGKRANDQTNMVVDPIGTWFSKENASTSPTTFPSFLMEDCRDLCGMTPKHHHHHHHQMSPYDTTSTCQAIWMKKWMRIIIRRIGSVYLNSPLLLALVPLLLGLCLGYLCGRYSHQRKEKRLNRNRSQVKVWYQGMKMNVVFVIVQMCWFQLSRFFVSSSPHEEEREEERENLNLQTQTRNLNAASSTSMMKPTSGIHPTLLPKHIAVIMDGNRRYGRSKHGNATEGHWEGARTTIDFARWCLAEGLEVLTVYAFSTENWKRDPEEIGALMTIFRRYCDELCVEGVKRGIRIRVLSTDVDQIPQDLQQKIQQMTNTTSHCTNFLLNICLSYGSRREIIQACRQLSSDVRSGILRSENDITESEFEKRLLTGDACRDPDVVLRTSGEVRVSNFLLWQLAYSELFFLEKKWPEVTREDLVDVIRGFAHGRKRRFGR